MDYVKAGLLSDILNTFKKLSGKLANFLDSITVKGNIKIGDVKKNSDGSISYTLEASDDSKLYAVTKPIKDKPGFLYIKVYTEDKKKYKEFEVVHESKIEDAFNKASNELLGLDLIEWGLSKNSEDDVESSKHIHVKLRKVTSNTSTRIQLKAIKANYDISEAYSDAMNVIQDDETCNLLGDQDTCFDIAVLPDSYEICIGEDFSVQDCARKLFANTYALLQVFQHVHWNSYGEDFLTLHNYCNDKISYLNWQVDTYAEIWSEVHGYVDVPSTTLQYADIVCPSITAYTGYTGFRYLEKTIHSYIDHINAMYVNFPRDVQSELDSTIRYWNKEVNYILRNITKCSYGGEGTCLL